MRIYSAYDPPPKVYVDCAGAGEEGRSKTKQSMKAETDINNILARFAKSGLLVHVNERSPVYADVSDVNDYREAISRVREVEGFFGGLPSKVRSHFGNDPAAFLDFMTDPSKAAEAAELGLIPKPEASEPVEPAPAPVVP